MTNLSPNTSDSEAEKLRNMIFSILDAQLQNADLQLRQYAKSLLVDGQTPSRADLDDKTVAIATEKVFQFIENSSLQTTKLLYLRANLTNWNSKKVLYMLTQKLVQTMSLEEIKKEIN